MLLLLQIMIGNAEYHCSCVQYASEDIIELIFGVVVAAVVLLLIIVITVVSVIVLRGRQQRNKKVKHEGPGDSDNVSMNEGGADQQYSRHLSDCNTDNCHQ